MFRKRHAIWWPPEAEKWGRIDMFGDPVTPASYLPVWKRFWSWLTRQR